MRWGKYLGPRHRAPMVVTTCLCTAMAVSTSLCAAELSLLDLILMVVL